MGYRMRIHSKLIIWLLGLAGGGLLLVMLLLLPLVRHNAEGVALRLGRAQVDGYAQQVAAPLNLWMDKLAALAHEFDSLNLGTAASDFQGFRQLAEKFYRATPSVYELWGAVDCRYLDRNYNHYNGYQRVTFRLREARTVQEVSLVDTAGLGEDQEYIALRDAGTTSITGPTRYTADSLEGLPYALRLTHALKDDMGIPAGLVGITFGVSYLQTLVQVMRPTKGAYTLLVSGQQSVIAGPDKKYCAEGASDVLQAVPDFAELWKRMVGGEKIAEVFRNGTSGERYLLFSTPIWIQGVKEPLTLCLVEPYSETAGAAGQTASLVEWIGGGALVLIFLLIILISNRIARPIQMASRSLSALARGEIDSGLKLNIKSHDELQTIGEATNALLEGLEAKANFAMAIGQGTTDAVLEASQDDVLGQKLIAMQHSLAEAKEREDRQHEVEEQQAWASRGIAQFSELLRKESGSIDEFSYRILHALVDYAGLQIGMVYLVEGIEANDPHLEVSASYAYQVRKFHRQRIELKEGLVARCATEKRRLLVTDIPAGYVRIASGLGQSEPNTLLLVPMLMNDMLQGVMEFASFGAVPEYKIQFIENVAGSFASTLLSVKNGIQTKQLLEEARRQGEEMRAQEETMRQNMEELKAIQEESRRQTAEFESLNRALQSACCVVEYSTDGQILNVNDEYLALLHATRDDLVGSHHLKGVMLSKERMQDYQIFWKDLCDGRTKRHVRNTVEFGGRRYTMIETYAPVLNERGGVEKIIKIAYDISAYVDEANGTAKESA